MIKVIGKSNRLKISGEDDNILRVTSTGGFITLSDEDEATTVSVTADKRQAKLLIEALNKFISGAPIGE